MAASNILDKEKTFKLTWTIRNWREVVPNQPVVRANNEFDLKEENVVYAKILIEVTSDRKDSFMFSWTLLSKPNLENAEATFVATVLKTDEIAVQYSVQADPLTEKQYEAKQPDTTVLDLDNASWTNPDGCIQIKLKCTLNVIRSSEIDEFKKTSKDALSLNWAAVLNGLNKKNSDVKIRTKDKIELFAHKIVLQAQCPVFASMFRSAFRESCTGIVNVDDISAKTMKILLNFWYTGNLLPSWMDDDTIVEFIYAAGKYEVILVLKMLNNFLGRDMQVTDVDIELLKITQQLSLKKAEARILKRIIFKIMEAKSGTEVLGYFSVEPDKFDENSVTTAQLFNVFNDALRENDDTLVNYADIQLMAYACDFGMTNVESKILKRIISVVSKVSNAEELFALLNLQK